MPMPHCCVGPITLCALLATCATAPPPAASFRFVAHPEGRELWFGDRPILREVTRSDPRANDDSSRTFVHVFAPDRSVLLTKGAGGHYAHHRGLFLGWNRTRVAGETFDFWHCGGGETLRWRAFEPQQELATPELARSVAQIDWLAADGRTIVRETRRLEVPQPTPTGFELAVEFTLASGGETVALDGDAHHAGCHFRAANEVATAEGARYERMNGARPRGNDLWDLPADAAVIEAHFAVGGQRYRVTLTSDPRNPGPVQGSMRSYGRFGTFARARLEPDQTLTLRYHIRVAVE